MLHRATRLANAKLHAVVRAGACVASFALAGSGCTKTSYVCSNKGDTASCQKWASNSVCDGDNCVTPASCLAAAYYLAEVGRCAGTDEWIAAKKDCKAAAASLGLPDTTPEAASNTDDPYGCYYKNSDKSLYWNKEGNKNDGDTDRVAVCSVTGAFSPTLMHPCMPCKHRLLQPQSWPCTDACGCRDERGRVRLAMTKGTCCVLRLAATDTPHTPVAAEAGACGAIKVTGSTAQWTRMGTYTRLEGVVRFGRPVYKHDDRDEYLFFVGAVQDWLIGPDFDGNRGGVSSANDTIAADAHLVPAGTWQDSNGGWQDNKAVKVDCVLATSTLIDL